MRNISYYRLEALCSNYQGANADSRAQSSAVCTVEDMQWSQAKVDWIRNGGHKWQKTRGLR